VGSSPVHLSEATAEHFSTARFYRFSLAPLEAPAVGCFRSRGGRRRPLIGGLGPIGNLYFVVTWSGSVVG